ncbi:MAG: peptide deformylase [Candidatus Caldarchaeum sp.]
MKATDRVIRNVIERLEREQDVESSQRLIPVFRESQQSDGEREILIYPHEMLRKTVSPLPVITPSDVKLIEQMILLSARHKAFGLAANQIGEDKRIIVITIGGFIHAIVNPVLTLKGKTVWSIEGCLSLPNLIVKIPRSERVIIEGLDMTGRKIALIEDGIVARALQHEVDHLNGVLIIDHVAVKDRKRLLSQYKSMNKLGDRLRKTKGGHIV